MTRLSVCGLVAAVLLTQACERSFIPEISMDEEMVVEGYIEAGDQPTPPYVFLTRSLPFFTSLETDGLDARFVRNAEIYVDDGSQRIQLTEVCLQELTEQQQQLFSRFIGLNTDSINLNICLYTDLQFRMLGEEGKTYELEVILEDNTAMVASTTIPEHVPLDSLYFRAPPGEPNDTLAQLRVTIQDPGNQADFYRYQTSVGEEPLVAPLGSVVNDELFDGQSFEFPLAKAEPRGAEFDHTSFGLFRRGTETTIKWMTIDELQFNFWNTLEFSLANQGPFSSYTRVTSNVEGGLGLWGGISASYYELAVPE